jgi:predicted RNA methylase
MYSLHFYGQMLADAPRMDAYAAALRETVNRDSVVMDLGCGPGVFALSRASLARGAFTLSNRESDWSGA